jgi:hypothetical protein
MKAEDEDKEDKWIESNNCCELQKSIACSYWDSLTVFRFLWITCLGIMSEGWMNENIVRPPWNSIAIPLFWVSSVGWDTL